MTTNDTAATTKIEATTDGRFALTYQKADGTWVLFGTYRTEAAAKGQLRRYGKYFA